MRRKKHVSTTLNNHSPLHSFATSDKDVAVLRLYISPQRNITTSLFRNSNIA
ncbi:MAG: hypothetical protein IPN94_16445 [Sphingobacteriales bacterium]|nr:hypothetical protein [Sphingobacteriales bacterium]